MSNYNSLKTTIDANIKQNGKQEITGQILNSVLNQMVNILGTGYQFAGIATIETNPGTPDAKVFYIANGKGTYEKFGGINVTEDDVVVLYWDSSWHKVSTGIASDEKLSELNSQIEAEATARTEADAELQTQINGKQDALTLTVKDNGNIVIGNIQGQTKEFMPATPSGDPMHYAYVAAGAEYNDTGADIVKTTPWADMIDDDYDGPYGKTIVHKAGYWYLNGLGDLTNNDMLHIMQTNRVLSAALYAGTSHEFRTNLSFEDNNPVLYTNNSDCSQLIRSNRNIEVLKLPTSPNYPFSPKSIDGLCKDASKITHIINILKGTYLLKLNNTTFQCPNLRTIKFRVLKHNVSFSLVSGLTLKSVLYMIKNEEATSAITITLHANVYNKCMANADILAALEAHPNVSLASA